MVTNGLLVHCVVLWGARTEAYLVNVISFHRRYGGLAKLMYNVLLYNIHVFVCIQAHIICNHMLWCTHHDVHVHTRTRAHTHAHKYHAHMYPCTHTHTVTMVNFAWFRRRNQQPLRFYDKPARERHYLSLVGSILCIVLLILAVALREWAKGSSKNCSYVFGLTQVQIKHSGPIDSSTEVKTSKSTHHLHV